MFCSHYQLSPVYSINYLEPDTLQSFSYIRQLKAKWELPVTQSEIVTKRCQKVVQALAVSVEIPQHVTSNSICQKTNYRINLTWIFRLYGATSVCFSCRNFFRRSVKSKRKTVLKCIRNSLSPCQFNKFTRNECK